MSWEKNWLYSKTWNLLKKWHNFCYRNTNVRRKECTTEYWHHNVSWLALFSVVSVVDLLRYQDFNVFAFQQISLMINVCNTACPDNQIQQQRWSVTIHLTPVLFLITVTKDHSYRTGLLEQLSCCLGKLFPIRPIRCWVER